MNQRDIFPVILDSGSVSRIVGMYDYQIFRMVKNGSFPKNITTLPGMPRGKYWLGVDVAAWVSSIPAEVKYAGDEEPIVKVRKLVIPSQFTVTHSDVISKSLKNDSIKSIDKHYFPAGVYFLINGGVISYIGKAKNIKDRLESHLTNKPGEFDAYFYFECFDRHWRSYLEAHYIGEFNPSINIQIPSLELSKLRLPDDAFEADA